MSIPPEGAGQKHWRNRAIGSRPSNLKENWRNINGVLRPDEERHSHLAETIKHFRENFLWISPIIVVGSFFFGALNLLGFTKFIGRPDIFVSSFEYGPVLSIFTLHFLLVYILIFFLYFISSCIFVSKLMELSSDKISVRQINFWLLGLVASFSSFASSTIMSFSYGWTWCSTFIPLVLFGVILFWFLDWYEKRNTENKISFSDLIFFIFIVVAINVIFMFLFGFMDSELKPQEKFLGWILASVLPLMPVFMFYSFDGKSYHSIMISGLSGVLLLHFGLLLMSGVFGLISASSMKFLGVTEEINRYYLVDSNQYPTDVLKEKYWEVEKRGDHHYLLKAFSLYHFGPVNLLCPAVLSKVGILNIKRHTDVCIAFREDEVRKLNVIEK